MCTTEPDEAGLEKESCVCETTTEECGDNEELVCTNELDGEETCTCKATEGCSEDE